MKITYLGTAAYEGVPAPFCKCRVCTLARERGGRNMRSRSQALINGELLVDFNADTVWHYHKYGFDWESIGDCIITHSHCDHLFEEDAEIAVEPYTREHRTINFYSGEDGYNRLMNYCGGKKKGATVTLVCAGDKFITSTGYEVTAFEADHDKSSSPLIYSVEKDGKKLLYAHDTGYFPESTWELLRDAGRFDFISLDCTGCLGLDGNWVNGHMSFGTDLDVIDRMKKLGLVDESTKIVINHFSHNGGQIYDEMLKEAQNHGIIVSYDGLEIEF